MTAAAESVPPSAPVSRPPIGAIVALSAVASATYVLLVVRARMTIGGQTVYTLVDDAMISMRYARHLADGHGLVWNIGDEPIQGFTNLGYTLAMSGFHLLPVGSSRVALFPLALTIVALLGTALATGQLVRALRPSASWGVLVAATLVLFDYGLVFWSTRGMEVPLITLPLAIALTGAVRWIDDGHTKHLRWVAVASAAAIVVRLDAAPVFMAVFACLLAFGVRSRPAAIGSVVGHGLLPTGIGAAVVGFQKVYFGGWLPNTYHLKAGGVGVAERIEVGWDVFIDNALPQLALLAGVAAIGIAAAPHPQRRHHWLLAAVAIVPVAYSIWAGGDYAEPQVHAPNRFMLLSVPPLSALAGVAVVDLGNRWDTTARQTARRLALAIATVLLLFVPNLDGWNELATGDIPLWSADRQRAELGFHLAETTPADTVVATHVAGQIPYFSERPTIDLLGKSDAVIANGPPVAPFRPGHNKWDYDYSIGTLGPDLVVDEWGAVEIYLAEDGRYTRLSNGVWVRAGSTATIDLDALGACYHDCGEATD